ncbi:hypothetical protein LCGC14_1912550 [marine sediment metagenome]|uniref:Uncharacterized protein n=1 Tax=marine sediment metagenome TaxID=412755 RepID=A0A0F9IR74_9ZZZZ
MSVSLHQAQEALRTGRMSELLHTHGKPAEAPDVRVNPLIEDAGYRRQSREAQHVGPWHRNLGVSYETLSHLRETHFCHGNCMTCAGHATDSLTSALQRMELLSLSDVYLEEHVANSKREADTIGRAVLRHGGVRTVIPLAEGDFRVICSVAVSGRTFPAGRELIPGSRAEYLNELLESVPRAYRHRLARFSPAWPMLEATPARFRVIASQPDESEEAETDRVAAERTSDKLASLNIAHHTRCAFSTDGRSVLHVDIFLPPDIADSPLKYSRLCSALGYHNIDPRFFQELAAKAAAA